MQSPDPLRNPADPLRKSGPDQGRELFRQFTRSAAGFSTEDAISAALNLLVNALRQAHAVRPAAERSYDEHVGKTRQLLLDHYDGVTGKRRNVFPHHQTIDMAHFDNRDKH